MTVRSNRREDGRRCGRGSPSPPSGPVPADLGGLVGPQFGITPEAVERWLGDDEGPADELRGVPASPGAVEGRARVVLSPAQIPEVRPGRDPGLPATAPAWAPVFAHVGAAVSDVGGTMSHAAILCREYGIPAVLGTGHATRRIATGDLLRVDGGAGTVTILERGASDLSRAMATSWTWRTPRPSRSTASAARRRPGAARRAWATPCRRASWSPPTRTAAGCEPRASRPQVARLAEIDGGYAARVAASEAIDALFAGAELAGRGDRPRLRPRRRRRRRGGGGPLERHRRGPRRRVVRRPAGDLPRRHRPRRVRRHVVRCWASLYSPQAIAYRRRLAIGADDVAMAVVVQRLVAAEAAGVMFTIDPLTGDPSQITIEAAFGLGLPIVGGEVTPDRYGVDKVTFELRSRRSPASRSPTASIRRHGRHPARPLDAARRLRAMPDRRRGHRPGHAGQARRAGLRSPRWTSSGRSGRVRRAARDAPRAGAARDGPQRRARRSPTPATPPARWTASSPRCSARRTEERAHEAQRRPHPHHARRQPRALARAARRHAGAGRSDGRHRRRDLRGARRRAQWQTSSATRSASGIDVVTDGEQGKLGFLQYLVRSVWTASRRASWPAADRRRRGSSRSTCSPSTTRSTCRSTRSGSGPTASNLWCASGRCATRARCRRSATSPA